MSTVKAMGKKVFPSTPVRVRIGRYTIMIINSPKSIGFRTSRDASATIARHSDRVSGFALFFLAKESLRAQFSTMTTAPSTMIPKSIAPRLMRFALTLFATIPVTAKSIDSGITRAVMTAARILPRKRNRTTMTRVAPSKRLLRTVRMVLSTRVVRL